MTHYQSSKEFKDPIPGVIVAGHFAELDSYNIKRSHGIRDCLITYTIKGEGYFITSGGKQICRSGDVTLVRGGIPHEYGTCRGKEWNFLWAHFSPELLEKRFELADGCMVESIDHAYLRRRIYRAFKRVIADSHERMPYWQELCQHALREIFLLLQQRHRHKMDSRVEQVLHLMSTQFKRPLSVSELAHSVSLSPSRLSHLFKEQVGTSIVSTFNRIRLDQAALLLEYTDRGPMEVAYDVGFQNYNHFAGLFRKQFGQSPKAYMNKVTAAK